MEQLEIPSGVAEIENELFSGCTSLKYLILPRGITFIGQSVLRGCSTLEAIYFKGDVSAWTQIVTDHPGEEFNDAKVYYYADPMPEENEGDYWHYDVDKVTPVVWKKEN